MKLLWRGCGTSIFQMKDINKLRGLPLTVEDWIILNIIIRSDSVHECFLIAFIFLCLRRKFQHDGTCMPKITDT